MNNENEWIYKKQWDRFFMSKINSEIFKGGKLYGR